MLDVELIFEDGIPNLFYLIGFSQPAQRSNDDDLVEIGDVKKSAKSM